MLNQDHQWQCCYPDLPGVNRTFGGYSLNTAKFSLCSTLQICFTSNTSKNAIVKQLSDRKKSFLNSSVTCRVVLLTSWMPKSWISLTQLSESVCWKDVLPKSKQCCQVKGVSLDASSRKNNKRCYAQVIKCSIKTGHLVTQLSLNKCLRKHTVLTNCSHLLKCYRGPASWLKKTYRTHKHFLPFLLRLFYNCSVLWGMDAGVWMHCLLSQHFLLTSDLLNGHFFFSS